MQPCPWCEVDRLTSENAELNEWLQEWLTFGKALLNSIEARKTCEVKE
jgi:hypothetical protein